MTKETVFSKIVNGDIPCSKVYEDDMVLAFKDINPDAKVHVLIIPKSNHLERLSDAKKTDLELLGHIMITITNIAKKLGIEESGYRVVTNSGKDANQEVDHLHFHILGGETLGSTNNN